jgi:hypothetical protein
MSLGLVVGIGLATTLGAARAETTWDKLEHGVDVVRECAGDIRSNCAGITPGGGRIKACMAAHLGNLSKGCITALATPKPEVLSDGDNAKPKHIENSHLMRFIEIFLAAIDPNTGDIIAECYGTCQSGYSSEQG